MISMATVWVKQKVELYEANGDLFLAIEPSVCEQNERIKFEEDNRLLRTNVCDFDTVRYECGDWEVEDAKISLTIGIKQFVPDFCELSNYEVIVMYEDVELSLEGDLLIISGKGIDKVSDYLDKELIEKISDGELSIKTFYTQSEEDIIIPSGTMCCED